MGDLRIRLELAWHVLRGRPLGYRLHFDNGAVKFDEPWPRTRLYGCMVTGARVAIDLSGPTPVVGRPFTAVDFVPVRVAAEPETHRWAYDLMRDEGIVCERCDRPIEPGMPYSEALDSVAGGGEPITVVICVYCGSETT